MKNIIVELTPKEFSIIVNSLANSRLSYFSKSRKKDIEKWRKAQFEQAIFDIDKIVKSFQDFINKNR